LVTLLDGNRGALDHELAKLLDYLEEREKATLDDIDRVSSGYQTSAVFELANQVVAGDAKRVLSTIRQFLAGGSTATGMLFYLGQHFISLYLVKSGKPLEGSKRWLTTKYKGQASSYSLARLEQIIEAIANADSALRRQAIPPGILLDQLVVGLMQPESTET